MSEFCRENDWFVLEGECLSDDITTSTRMKTRITLVQVCVRCDSVNFCNHWICYQFFFLKFNHLSFFLLDTEPPWLQCPADIVAETDERRGTSNVNWNIPVATDNSKDEVTEKIKKISLKTFEKVILFYTRQLFFCHLTFFSHL